MAGAKKGLLPSTDSPIVTYCRTLVLYGVFNRIELIQCFDEVQFEVDAEFFQELGIYLGESILNLHEYR